MISKEDVPSFVTIKQFCVRYPWPSESAMRAYVSRAARFGLENAFVRVGGRVLVNPEKFFLAIQDQPKKKRKRKKRL